MEYGKPLHTENAKEISRLKWIREMKGYSQASLSRATGLNLKTIRSFECGYRDINRAEAQTVYKLASVLGVRMEELLNV